MKTSSKVIIVICLCLTSCFISNQNKKEDIRINEEYSLLKKNDSLYYIQIKTDSTLNKWELPFPVYQFKTGDVDADGKEDILVGVTKKTRFDPKIGNRLFIFKNYKGLVRPLWLGSRLGQPLVDFNFVKTNEGSYIRSIEVEKSKKYLVAEYKWRKFGLEFTKYIEREIDINKAMILLKK